MFGVDIRQLNGNQVMNLETNPDNWLDWNFSEKYSITFSVGRSWLTISFVTGSLFLRREVTTSTMASWSFGNLNSSCRVKQSEFALDVAVLYIYSMSACFWPVCCSCYSVGWSSASPREPAPHSADWDPPDVWFAASQAAQTKLQAQIKQASGPVKNQVSCKLSKRYLIL